MRELERIQRIFDGIDGNKKLVHEVMVRPIDVAASYPNLIFASRTQRDEINKALLDDLQKAAEVTGYDINVNFAKTDHGKNTKSGNVSRHYTNQAVDIGSIGGKTVNPSNRSIVDKYVDALLSMGYAKNSEGGNSKAVLTFGFPGHDDHIHVSNKESSSSELEPDYTPASTDDSSTQSADNSSENESSKNKSKSTSSADLDPELFKAALGLGKLFGLNEDFGRNISSSYGTISIPGSSNPVIKSPVDGVINNIKKISGCKNQVTIESDDSEYFLQYCGMSKSLVRDGDSVSEGQIIGRVDKNENVEVVLLNRSYYRQNIKPSEFEKKYSQKKSKKRSYVDDSADKKIKTDSGRSYSDPALASLILAPFEIFKDRYDKKTGELVQKRWAETGEKRQTDPFVIDAIKAPFKKVASMFKKGKNENHIKEDIEKIKRLLK